MPIDARKRKFVFLLIALGSMPAKLRAADSAPAPGTQVVLKAGTILKVGEKAVETGGKHRVYKVDRATGPWLWLVSGNIAGWARAADALTFDKAIELYTAEIARNIHSPWPYYNRGLIYQDRGDFDKAQTDYSTALQQDPNFVPALINRGNLWLRRGSYDRAITDYGAAIKNDPKDELAYLNRGIALQGKKEFEKATADYSEAIKLGLKTPSIYNNRGHAREVMKDYDGAIADYSEAIRLDPAYPLPRINRGSARESNGDYEGALADDAEAVRLTPKSPWGYSGQAWIMATCPEAKYRNGAKAVGLATKACELSESKNPSFLDVRAAAHAEAGQFAEAIHWETRAIALVPKTSPGDADVYRARLKLYQEKKPYRDEQSGGVTANR
jgi:tetratricopeptide (TPR) repeat protein